jgi:hypothetical protein
MKHTLHTKLLTAGAIIIVFAMLLLLPSTIQRPTRAQESEAIDNGVSTQDQSETPDLPDNPTFAHRVTAAYYSVAGKQSATLTLNNKGLTALQVQPTFFSLAGEQLEGPPLTVEPTSYKSFNLSDYVSAGTPFEEGSLHLVYHGNDLQMGSQVRIVDAEHSVSFDEQLVEPVVHFTSSRLEGVWWLPSRTADVRLIMSNTSDRELSATANIGNHGVQARIPLTVTLMPHETRVIDLRAAQAAHGGGRLPEADGVSITHTGGPGALIGRVLVHEVATGYSSISELVDPDKAKSSKLHGAGLRLGSVAGDELTPVMVARNNSNSTAVVSGRIPYTGNDGRTGVVTLPEISIAPGQAKVMKAASAAVRKLRLGENIISAGVEFEHTAQPGGVVMSVYSVSQSGNQVFRVPLLDAAGHKSSTGGYPWYIYGDSSTFVYIKNTTDHERVYVAHLNSSGGKYVIGQRAIKPNETVTFDMRAMRDNQVPDEKGRKIPPNATRGQFKWSVVRDETQEDLVMIGRSEQADTIKAVSSSYACASCCADSSTGGRVDPYFGDTIDADGVTDFDAMETFQDCNGEEYEAERLYAHWSSSDGEVASVTSTGEVTGLNGGEASITATWAGRMYYSNPCYYYYGTEIASARCLADMPLSLASNFSVTDATMFLLPPCGACTYNSYQIRRSSTVRVKPKITSMTPTRGLIGNAVSVTIDGRGFGSNPSVIFGGTGITYSGSGGSSTRLTGTFTIAANATGGDHTVQVANKGQKSNSVNFFVQIPSEFIPVGLAATDLGCGVHEPTGQQTVGQGGAITYQVADQAGQVIAVEGLTPQEHFTVTDANGTREAFPGFRPFSTPQATDANGKFVDIPVGTCFLPSTTNGCVVVRQTFNIIVPLSGGGTATYDIPTVTSRCDCLQGLGIRVTTGTTTRSSTLGTTNCS